MLSKKFLQMFPAQGKLMKEGKDELYRRLPGAFIPVEAPHS